MIVAEYILQPPLHAVHENGPTRGDGIRDEAATDLAFGGILPVLAVECAEIRVKVVGRLPGDDVESAGDGIVTEESRLRPFQDLDAIQVEESSIRGTRAPMIDVIDESPNRLVERRVDAGADATNVCLVGTAVLPHVHVRRRLAQILERVQVLLAQHL